MTSRNYLFWAGVESWGAQLSQLLAYVIIARFLNPNEFGLYAFANIFFISIRSITAVALIDSLVQKKITMTPLVHTFFWIIFGLFILFIPMLSSLGFFLEQPLKMPGLGPVLALLSCGFLTFGLSVVPEALCVEQLHFRPLAIRRIAEQTIGGLAGVIGAYFGLGTYALVAQVLVGSFVGTALLWLFTKYKPRFIFNLNELIVLKQFFFQRLGSAFMAIIGQRLDSFVVGFIFGPLALGYYSIAWRLNSITSIFTNAAINRMAFPLFSSYRDNPTAFRLTFESCSHSASILGALGYFSLFSLSKPLLLAFFGPNWEPAVPILQGFSIFGLLVNGIFVTQNALRALGLADVEFRFSIINNIAFLLLLPFFVLKGLSWVPCVLFISALLGTPYLFINLKRVSGISVQQLFAHSFKPWIAGAVAASTAWLWVNFFSWTLIQSPIIQFITGGAVFLFIYILILFLLDRRFIFSFFADRIFY